MEKNLEDICDKSSKILLTNIQRCSLHDGPGIRTTVFTKGCLLCCPWCSNPENIKMIAESYSKNGARGIYGKYMSCDEIYNEVIKDKMFYNKLDMELGLSDSLRDMPGGVTFSGGEALLWADKLQPLWQRLSEEHVHIVVETALEVSVQMIEIALKYVNIFYVDVKIPEPKKYKLIVGGCFKRYMKNLYYLFENQVPVVFRVPVIGGYTDTIQNRKLVLDIIKTYCPLKVELIKGHNLGNSKYKSLGKNVPDYCEVNDIFLEEYKNMIRESGIDVEVCKVS